MVDSLGLNGIKIVSPSVTVIVVDELTSSQSVKYENDAVASEGVKLKISLWAVYSFFTVTVIPASPVPDTGCGAA